MARARKSDKFYIYAPVRSGSAKGKRPMGVNINYEGGRDTVTYQNLMDFWKAHGVDPAMVKLPRGFFEAV